MNDFSKRKLSLYKKSSKRRGRRSTVIQYKINKFFRELQEVQVEAVESSWEQDKRFRYLCGPLMPYSILPLISNTNVRTINDFNKLSRY